VTITIYIKYAQIGHWINVAICKRPRHKGEQVIFLFQLGDQLFLVLRGRQIDHVMVVKSRIGFETRSIAIFPHKADFVQISLHKNGWPPE